MDFDGTLFSPWLFKLRGQIILFVVRPYSHILCICFKSLFISFLFVLNIHSVLSNTKLFNPNYLTHLPQQVHSHSEWTGE